MAEDQGGRGDRDRHRDDDDVRDPMLPDDRNADRDAHRNADRRADRDEVKPDTRDDARGDPGRRPDLFEFQDDQLRRIEQGRPSGRGISLRSMTALQSEAH